MSELRGGTGGYGGITTMNQDQRQGKYAPHKAIVRIKNLMTGIVGVRCFHCGGRWTHPEGVVQNTPPSCGGSRVR